MDTEENKYKHDIDCTKTLTLEGVSSLFPLLSFFPPNKAYNRKHLWPCPTFRQPHRDNTFTSTIFELELSLPVQFCESKSNMISPYIAQLSVLQCSSSSLYHRSKHILNQEGQFFNQALTAFWFRRSLCERKPHQTLNNSHQNKPPVHFHNLKLVSL